MAFDAPGGDAGNPVHNGFFSTLLGPNWRSPAVPKYAPGQQPSIASANDPQAAMPPQQPQTQTLKNWLGLSDSPGYQTNPRLTPGTMGLIGGMTNLLSHAQQAQRGPATTGGPGSANGIYGV